MKGSTLKNQLLVPIIILITIIFGIYSYLGYNTISNKLWSDHNSSVNRTEKRLKKNLRGPIWNLEEEIIRTILTSELEKKSIFSIIVLDRNGKDILLGLKKNKNNKIIELKDVKRPFSYLKKRRGKILPPSSKEDGKSNVHTAHYIMFIDDSHIIDLLTTEIISVIFTVVIFNIVIGFIIYTFSTRKVIEPLKEISEISSRVSNGDFSKMISDKYTVGGDNEVFSLSKSMNKMIVKIEKLTTNLKKEVENQTKEIQVQNENFFNLLSNLNQGFMIIDKKGIVQKGATKVSLKMFGVDPVDKKMEDILQLNATERINYNKWLKHTFNGIVPFKDLIPLAPKFFNKNEEKIISLDYRPIFNKKNKKIINQVIFIATDITEKVKLEKKAEIEKEKAKRLISILDRPLEFIDLINEIEEVINHYKENIRNSRPDGIFRNFHTLKARFGGFQISKTVQNIHELESYLNEIETDWSEDNVNKVWYLIEKIRLDHLEFTKENQRLVEIANNSISSNGEGVSSSSLMKKIEADYAAYYKEFVLQELSILFQTFILPTKELAKQQDKLVEIKLEKSDIFINPKNYKNCFSTFIHIFRNSIDHGIESREERISKNKSEIAHLNISMESIENEDFFKIVIKDDGKGIDPNVIKSVALNKKELQYLNLEMMTDKEITNLIFEPGFSSKENTSEVSGRGVGMNAVKTEIEKLGGSIIVKSKIDQCTIFEITLPLFT